MRDTQTKSTKISVHGDFSHRHSSMRRPQGQSAWFVFKSVWLAQQRWTLSIIKIGDISNVVPCRQLLPFSCLNWVNSQLVDTTQTNQMANPLTSNQFTLWNSCPVKFDFYSGTPCPDTLWLWLGYDVLLARCFWNWLGWSAITLAKEVKALYLVTYVSDSCSQCLPERLNVFGYPNSPSWTTVSDMSEIVQKKPMSVTTLMYLVVSTKYMNHPDFIFEFSWLSCDTLVS